MTLMLKTVLGRFGRKIKILHIFCLKSHFLIWNTKITNEVLNDSVMLKTELGRFGRKIKILHILHKIAYFDLEHQNNQWGGSK